MDRQQDELAGHRAGAPVQPLGSEHGVAVDAELLLRQRQRLAARHAQSVQRLNDAIESYIRRSQESGVVRSDIPALTVAQVVHALVSSGALTTADPVTPEQLAQYWSAVEVALAGFLA